MSTFRIKTLAAACACGITYALAIPFVDEPKVDVPAFVIDERANETARAIASAGKFVGWPATVGAHVNSTGSVDRQIAAATIEEMVVVATRDTPPIDERIALFEDEQEQRCVAQSAERGRLDRAVDALACPPDIAAMVVNLDAMRELGAA